MSKEEVCTNVDMKQFTSTDYMKCVNQSIKEGEKVVGKILYIQPSKIDKSLKGKYILLYGIC